MRLLGLCVGMALTLAVGACTQAVVQKEDLLAAAGFKIVPADTAKRQAALHKMPAHKFSMQNRHDQVVWVYADPTICNCVYLGTQQAYDTYRQLVFQKSLVNEEQTVAQMNEYNAMPYPFAWEEFGPGTPYF